MRGVGMEGLFRLSGSQDEVLKLKDDFDARAFPALKRADDHALTGVFKLALRKMHNPLIPFAHYQTFIASAQHEAKSDHTALLKTLLPKLPVANQNGLQYLLAFLYRVCVAPPCAALLCCAVLCPTVGRAEPWCGARVCRCRRSTTRIR